MQDTIGSTPLPQVTGQTCSKCAHASICSVLRAVAPLLESMGEDAPMQVAHLAQICTIYLPLSVVSLLEGDMQ